MKKVFSIKGMRCNSCSRLIEGELKEKVNSISVNYVKEQAEIDFSPETISEKEIKDKIKRLGYEIADDGCLDNSISKKTDAKKDNSGLFALITSILVFGFVIYYFFLRELHIGIPGAGESTSLLLLFLAGILTGFHCISMCGAFVVSYTTKNAIKGHKSYKQHLAYGGSKLISYTFIGGIFGLVGGIFAFSTGLRAGVAIFAGVFMIFYALSMFGFNFFRRFQINPKFLTNFAVKSSANAKGPYKGPIVTGLLNGLFIACGPLQAMYLYAAGTGSFTGGATALAVFGLGTLPIMIGFGAFASVINHKTTRTILKISAIVVLILGLIMLNRGLAMVGSPYSFSAIKSTLTENVIQGGTAASGVKIVNGVQEVNMDVDGGGYSPNSFVLKKGVPVKWNVNVKQLTGCNQELVLNQYSIDRNLKSGLNVIEFTPDKEGTLTFTCGMGMLRGRFIVTESGTASNEQIASTASTNQGGSCGGSCGNATCSASGGGCGCGG